MEKKNSLTFATFFPGCENFHLTKEVGAVPFILYRDFGYDSSIICYENGEYPHLKTQSSGLKLLFMRRSIGYYMGRIWRSIFKDEDVWGIEDICTFIDAIPAILRYGRHIDVLQVYHIRNHSILVGWLYKLINRRGVLYMRLDMDPRDILSKGEPEMRWSVFRRKAPIDIMSVETREPYGYMSNEHPFFRLFKNRLYYIPSGVDIKTMPTAKVPRENIILHVARMGTYQKASEVVLETFANVAGEFPNWHLVLAGKMENGFDDYYKKFLDSHPGIMDRIRYVGYISSKENIFELYAKSRILAIPSRYESFGLVAAEAGIFENAILGSDIPSLRDMTDGGRLGYLCPVGDIDCFTRMLKHILTHEDEMEEKSMALSTFLRSNFDWHNICGNIDSIIREKIKRVDDGRK
jgi:glycosyltransferase involved in cell wall biosynthesis